ncbi:hypothetical protein NDU88_007137 [Pleurodeles waltl]|uniref:Uncharacterized protein n=1 Tax=Pleurodeles waltl TaxID=8319 RepID=A0AAV7TZ71_PLEWA|nr:hypothetical protein NDU88_007137 [Pleurodeles waltl]
MKKCYVTEQLLSCRSWRYPEVNQAFLRAQGDDRAVITQKHWRHPCYRGIKVGGRVLERHRHRSRNTDKMRGTKEGRGKVSEEVGRKRRTRGRGALVREAIGEIRDGDIEECSGGDQRTCRMPRRC